ncbi:sigma factor G inhibitor Gin [Alicyclobacillus sp.]|uniref:sigma factor G inhibitor Gin n=1 Tax=Alicyclobacillus sp. TaxID=61169 RepID=UPI0025BBADA2|nr:sigma factor G inhibitor Gin [Alicyclobacillus sp.]MCL6516607.1 sigma factor G inhibitor Gin [Alicyclobacillus sp.]
MGRVMGLDAKQARCCIVCGQAKTDGISVCGQFICMDCERAIVTTDVDDVRYRHYVDCMKRIWWQVAP